MQKLSHWLLYLLLVITGAVLLLLYTICFTSNQRIPGTEYYYSGMLNDGFNIYTGILLFLVGTITGYFSKANSWGTGISLILSLPVVALIEASVYRGSHNLIPFELLVYFAYALPGVFGSFVGKRLRSRTV